MKLPVSRKAFSLTIASFSLILVFLLNIYKNLFITSIFRAVVAFFLFYIFGSLLHFITFYLSIKNTTYSRNKESINNSKINLSTNNDLKLDDIYNTNNSDINIKNLESDFEPLKFEKIEVKN